MVLAELNIRTAATPHSRETFSKGEQDCPGGATVAQGCTQMPMGSNKLKFISCAQKPRTGLTSQDISSDVAILNMAVDSQSLLRGISSRFSSRRDRGVIDDVFEALLAEANKEFLSLLRMYTRSRTTRCPVTLEVSRSVSFLVRRSSLCTKQYCYRQNWAILPSPTSSRACITVAGLWPWRNVN